MPLTTRRSLLTGALSAAALAPLAARAGEPPRSIMNISDFDELWRTLDERYCYFGEKTTDWQAVRRLYRPQALAAESPEALFDVISAVLRELYDAHSWAHDAPDGAPRLPYFDLWVEPDGAAARVTSVRAGSSAEDAGIRPGDVVHGVDGLAIGEVAAGLAPRCLSRPDPAAAAYALNLAVSGRIGRPRRLQVRTGDQVREALLALKDTPSPPAIERRRLPSGHGLIAIHSFAGDGLVEAFDAALLEFRDTPGLVLDLRQNGGGDTAIARPMMGRFITEPRPYARMRRRQGRGLSAAWTETVEPRGPFTYTAPVVVLTSRWSASMAEGFPMGMKGIGRATVVGTPMMGLGAGVFPLRLDRTGIDVQYSAEPVYDVNDRPRSLMRPDVEVAPGEDILAAGVAVLDRKS